MTWDVPTAEDCPRCGQTLFKKSGRGRMKPFCINEACSAFLPEEKRGYKNPMEIPKLVKIVINTGVGTDKDREVMQSATETLALIADDEAVKAHPEYGTLRSMRCEQDYFFGGNALHQILARQMESNPKNRMAFEYLEAACLLAKDVDRAMQYYPLSEPLGYQAVPGEIQQAMLLLWSQNHRETEPIPDIFHPEMVKGFRNFHTTMQMTNGNRSAVQKSFGNTYWYYYFFQ